MGIRGHPEATVSKHSMNYFRNWRTQQEVLHEIIIRYIIYTLDMLICYVDIYIIAFVSIGTIYKMEYLLTIYHISYNELPV